MGNSNKPKPASPPAGPDKPGFMSGSQSLQGQAGNAGGAMQFAGAGNQATSGAGAQPATAPGVPPPQISLDQAQEMALQITTFFEGGRSMNYQALAGDFDGQGASFGLIQWNFGQNTLGPLLNRMVANNATSFAGCFGPAANFSVLKAALDNQSQAGQLTWTRVLEKQNNAAWKAAFQALGAVDDFNRIQREQAAAQYHPLVMQAVGQLRAIAPALMGKLEFRSYAALFDLCVQQSSISKAIDAIKARAKAENPARQVDLLKIAVVERGKVASSDWRSDCISRRMGILNAAPFESTENGITKKRGNPQFALVAQFGAAQVAGI